MAIEVRKTNWRDSLPVQFFLSIAAPACKSIAPNRMSVALPGGFRIELAGPGSEPGRLPSLYDHFKTVLRARGGW